MQINKTDNTFNNVYNVCSKCGEIFVLHSSEVKFLINKSDNDVITTPSQCKYCSQDKSRLYKWGDLLMSEVFSPPRDVASYIGFPPVVNGYFTENGKIAFGSDVSQENRDAYVKYCEKFNNIQKMIAGIEFRKKDILKDLARILLLTTKI